MCSLWQDLSLRTKNFDLATLTLTFDQLLKKLNLRHNFLTKRDGAFILHVCISCGNTFLLVPKNLTLWPWPWLWPTFGKTWIWLPRGGISPVGTDPDLVLNLWCILWTWQTFLLKTLRNSNPIEKKNKAIYFCELLFLQLYLLILIQNLYFTKDIIQRKFSFTCNLLALHRKINSCNVFHFLFFCLFIFLPHYTMKTTKDTSEYTCMCSSPT